MNNKNPSMLNYMIRILNIIFLCNNNLIQIYYIFINISLLLIGSSKSFILLYKPLLKVNWIVIYGDMSWWFFIIFISPHVVSSDVDNLLHIYTMLNYRVFYTKETPQVVEQFKQNFNFYMLFWLSLIINEVYLIYEWTFY